MEELERSNLTIKEEKKLKEKIKKLKKEVLILNSNLKSVIEEQYNKNNGLCNDCIKEVEK